ncbi:MAG: type VI secretion system-associated protein TagF [Polyangiales bacterium]
MNAVGLFGKMRSAGDFVGLHARAEASAVQQWLQRAHEIAGGASVEEPVYFVASFPGTNQTFCGAWIPSEDRVGRRFPLLTFLPIAADLMGVSRGHLPALIQPFLDAAVSLMTEARDASFAELSLALARAPRPDASLLGRVVAQCGQESRDERVSTFVKRVFGDDPGQLAYALHAVAIACEPLRDAPPVSAAVSLDCPMTIDLDLFFWADLIHRKLGWRDGGPGLFWTEQTPRLVAALGPAAPGTLSQLGSTQVSGSFWPLWTAREDARARAVRSLSTRVRQVLDADESLHALAECA